MERFVLLLSFGVFRTILFGQKNHDSIIKTIELSQFYREEMIHSDSCKLLMCSRKFKNGFINFVHFLWNFDTNNLCLPLVILSIKRALFHKVYRIL